MSEPLCHLCLQTGHKVLAHRILPGGKGVCRDHFAGALMPAGVVTEIAVEPEAEIEVIKEEDAMAVRIPIDEERLRQLHAQGMKDAQIGKELGRSGPTICAHRKRLGLKANFGGGERRPKKKVMDMQRKAARIERNLDAVTIDATEDLCNGIWASLPLAKKAQLINKLGELAA